MINQLILLMCYIIKYSQFCLHGGFLFINGDTNINIVVIFHAIKGLKVSIPAPSTPILFNDWVFFFILSITKLYFYYR